STVSREFFYIRNSFSKERRLFLYQSAEIDLNRDWRKELAGETLSFSNLFFSARYRFNRWLTTGITLDNRKNYWTYEVRTISEELFDNSFRRGLRGTVSLRLPGHYFIYGNAGIRKLETNSESTYSYTGGLRKANFLVNRLSIGLNYAGFSNQFTDGYTATFRIGKSFRHGERIDLSIG
ncbi:MAG: hypothetical protein GWN00_26100, partial [Aliifodinibius sp.]|nr:hypothetical protein [candidate division Zixibacteria bacterium]NIT59565.1 hypothetical protein [Fodinibius sp.]NIW47049.1 hypothetical protein [Gammaproteobacteria bacterium]NIS47599.1 hypothetical protein [candidate division Zixibacteria bacterium]NIU15683.1 hypothetical protein [candidate division Zixibacteria bacterium]